MRRGLFIAAGLAASLGAGVALAQAPGGAPPGPGPEVGPPGEMMHGGMGMHGQGMHGHGMHRPPPPSKAARFMFRRGDAVVAIKCADDEPMKACVDAGSTLLDKLAAQQK